MALATNDATKQTKRHQIGIFMFVLFSVGGLGFIIKGVISQWTEWGDNTLILYVIATLVYAVPFVLMIFEFSSLKKLKNAETGYQTWLNLVLGRKLGFMGGFFYFFVNLFYFLSLIPNMVNYAIFLVLGNDGTSEINQLNENLWWKPVISLTSIIVFWIATYISARGPKWLLKIGGGAGFVGLAFTITFIIAGLVLLGKGGADYVDDKGVVHSQETLKVYSDFDISWGQLGSLSWALQSLGGLEAIAAYKNNIKGGEKRFRLGFWLIVAIFSSIMFLCSILVQYALPEFAGKDLGLLSAAYVAFSQVGFPSWWTNFLGFGFLFTTLAGSLMIWTAAPVKILFADAPTGIFGKRLSYTTKEGTPVNGLIAQGLIVTILFILQAIGSLNSSMNLFLETIQNLNAGAATLPVLFMIICYLKMVWQHDNPQFERDYKVSNIIKNNNVILKRLVPVLLVTPMVIIFIIATLTSLIPPPEQWESDDLKNPIMQIVLGPIGIILAFIYCNYIFNRWRKKNPDDKSLFNKMGTNEKIISKVIKKGDNLKQS